MPERSQTMPVGNHRTPLVGFPGMFRRVPGLFVPCQVFLLSILLAGAMGMRRAIV
jgi:hypothetical protein